MNIPLVYGTSVIGPGHIRSNLPNQDSFYVKNFGNYSLLVISDGMGSKKYADVGSNATCHAVYKALSRYIYTKNRHHKKNRNLFEMIRKEWLKLIAPYEPKDCSATCLFILKSKSKCLAAMLGDGLIYMKMKDFEDSILMIDEKENEFSNSTVSMSDNNYLNEWKYKFVSTKNLCGILMTSDGISSDLLSGKEKEFSDDLLKSIKNEKGILRKKQYLDDLINNWPVPKHSDDKTIVVMEIK